MQKCWVCGKEFDADRAVCPFCGFDESSDREHYPTLACPKKPEPSMAGRVHQQTQNRSAAQKPARESSFADLGNNPSTGRREAPYRRRGGKVIKQGICGETIQWTLYQDGTMVLSGEGKMQEFGVLFNRPPWKKNLKDILALEVGKGITSIGRNAFTWAKNLERIQLPDTLTFIDWGAFWDCERLKAIAVPDSVRKIGGSAFWCCMQLETIELPKDCTEIGQEAFGHCKNLKQAALPWNLRVIPEGMFFQCAKLHSVSIPTNLEEIQSRAFQGCTALKVLRVSPKTVIAPNALQECPAKVLRVRRICRSGM